ncbi:MAG: outer membrane lipoprotein carrier protein LolA [Leptospirales bacterium]|nr:outer membrane lipoprotein carrier protein LolA [Leptospirales bacterium]
MKTRIWAHFSAISSAFLLLFSPLNGEEKRLVSHADVARKVMDVYEKMNTFSAQFQITTQDGATSKAMSGSCAYKNPGKVRFSFDAPAGNLIVSDGRTLWVYIARLNAAGKQDLRLQKKDENGKNIFLDTAGPGVSRLFRKYHYRFDKAEQPRTEDGMNVFVLEMDQREKTGGYEKIKLFIDSNSFLIRRAVASDGQGKTSTLTFRNGEVNPTLEGKIFQYDPPESVRVVANPLVSE